MGKRVFGPLLLAVAAVVLGYWRVVRPWMLRWGTREDESRRTLPGDELVPDPAINTTRAVTIQAPPTGVWAWLVQIGQDRGGFYSYDWLENLFGLDIHSADEIEPDLQQLEVGDFVALAPQEGAGLVVKQIEPERALVLFAPDPEYHAVIQPSLEDDELEFTGSWSFVLEPMGSHTTRLLARLRIGHAPNPLVSVLLRVLLEPAHFIMERKMLLGIKQRAERAAAEG